MKKTISKAIFLAFWGIAASAVAARADIVIYDGLEGGSGDVQNVMLNDFGSDDAGFTVDGYLNRDRDTVVMFSGTEQLVTPSGGQARVTAMDGAFTSLTFRLQDPTMGFDKVQFNIDAENDGPVNLIFTDQFNSEWSKVFRLDRSGENFFTAIASNGQVIRSVSLESSVGITSMSDLGQVRLNPVPIAGVVPEPATMVLIGAGMAGIGFFGSRRRRKK